MSNRTWAPSYSVKFVFHKVMSVRSLSSNSGVNFCVMRSCRANSVERRWLCENVMDETYLNDVIRSIDVSKMLTASGKLVSVWRPILISTLVSKLTPCAGVIFSRKWSSVSKMSVFVVQLSLLTTSRADMSFAAQFGAVLEFLPSQYIIDSGNLANGTGVQVWEAVRRAAAMAGLVVGFGTFWPQNVGSCGGVGSLRALSDEFGFGAFEICLVSNAIIFARICVWRSRARSTCVCRCTARSCRYTWGTISGRRIVFFLSREEDLAEVSEELWPSFPLSPLERGLTGGW